MYNSHKYAQPGEVAIMADSIMRYSLQHRFIQDPIVLYNAWSRDVAFEKGFEPCDSKSLQYLLMIAESCIRSSEEQLQLCVDIEDSFK